MKWISIAKRIPKHSFETVLVKKDEIECRAALDRIDKEGRAYWCSVYSNMAPLSFEPTHWMPLPEAPSNSDSG